MGANIQIAKFFFKRKQFVDAIKELEEILKEDPEELEAIHLKCFCLSELGKHSEAFQTAYFAINLDPDDDYSYFVLSKILTKDNRVEEALKALDKAITINDNCSNYYLHQSHLFARQKEWSKMLEAAEIGLDIDPYSIHCLHNRAIALRGKGNIVEAKNVLKRTLRLNNKYLYSWLNLGWILLESGEKAKEVLFYFKRAKSIDPNFPQVDYGILTAIKARKEFYRKFILPTVLWEMKVSSSTEYLQLTFLILLCRFCLSLSEHIGTQINHLFLVSICTINLTIILLGNYLSNFFLKKGQYRLLKQTRREKFFDGILALSKAGTIVWSITGITQSLLISGNLFMSSIIIAIIISSSNQKQRNIMIVYGIMMILLGWLICFQSLIQPHNVQFSTIYFFLAGTFGAIILRRIINFQLTIKAKLNS